MEHASKLCLCREVACLNSTNSIKNSRNRFCQNDALSVSMFTNRFLLKLNSLRNDLLVVNILTNPERTKHYSNQFDALYSSAS